MPDIVIRFASGMPKISWYFWNLADIFLLYASNLCEVCQRYKSNMTEIFLIYACDMPEICSRFLWNIPEICQFYMRFVRTCITYNSDMPQICLRFSSDFLLPEICQICTWDLLEIYLSIVWDMPEIRLKYG